MRTDNTIVAGVNESPSAAEPAVQNLTPEGQGQSLGRLKVFLGYASGVGKSFRMLDEGRRRRERGQDVVVGAVQPKVSADVQQVISTLEVIPVKTVDGCPVMDVPAILARKPKICLVDGLGYDNPPGSPHAKRWQDVAQLLEAGISVITSVNLQHIEQMRTRVEAITGKRVTQTVPVSFLQTADEIVIVDTPPESSMSITDDGPSASQNLSQAQLSALREIALLLAADVVDKQLERYLASHGINQLWGTQERILVWLSPNSDAKRMLESGVRNRDRFHGELIVAYIGGLDWPSPQRERMQGDLELARQKGAEIIELSGDDSVESILRFSRQRGITQIYVGHKGREHWWERARSSEVDRLIGSAEGMDVRVFPHSS